DGHSMAIDGGGTLSHPAPLCEEVLLCVDFDPASGRFDYRHWPAGVTERLPLLWAVLKRGLRDYTFKNGFGSVVCGLAGGIDPSLTVALAVVALGPDRVLPVMMPSRHTAELSLTLASEQVEMLGTPFENISVEP